MPARSSGVTFGWPLKGTVLQNFDETSNAASRSAGVPGRRSSAAADGKVIFSGAGPRGYGNLVIVKHESELLSVYANNSSLAVKEGQEVRRGPEDRRSGYGDQSAEVAFRDPTAGQADRSAWHPALALTPRSFRILMALPPSLVFDIETIPDTAGLRLAWSLGGSGPDALDDAAVAQAALDRRREATGRDFLPHHLHRIVAIGCVFRNGDDVRIRCLGEPGDDERRLINDFFRAIERYKPQLVSWNGGGFDLPVLHYRALIHGMRAPRYWDHGETDRDFRFNNYLSRFHSRHLDLMDVLAGYTGRANAPLDELARLCGLPGKLGMDGSQVWPAWQRGRDRTDPRLLRDRCRQHLVALLPLPLDERAADVGRVR